MRKSMLAAFVEEMGHQHEHLLEGATDEEGSEDDAPLETALLAPPHVYPLRVYVYMSGREYVPPSVCSSVYMSFLCVCLLPPPSYVSPYVCPFRVYITLPMKISDFVNARFSSAKNLIFG